MDKRKLKDFMDFIKNPKNKKYVKYIKYAITAVIVVIALMFFGNNGKKSDNFSTEAVNNQIALNQELEDEETNAKNDQENEPDEIYIDIEGVVKKPGVYKVKSETRIYEVIELAGGLLPGADISQINQAETVYDGEKITIYEEGEITTEKENYSTQAQNNFITADGLININTADSTGLQEIPGVGPATAEKIIAYRQANGQFNNIEDIKNVSGIGDKTFEKIKTMITV